MRERSKYYDDVLALRERGLSYEAIAKELGIGYHAAYNIIYHASAWDRRTKTRDSKKEGPNWDRINADLVPTEPGGP